MMVYHVAQKIGAPYHSVLLASEKKQVISSYVDIILSIP